jgi:hypothetical protein
MQPVTDSRIVVPMSDPSTVTDVSPAPTADEVVAIMAATEALWPRPVIAAPEEARRSTAWRFSGRWWSRPVPARRDRPFR